MAAQLIDLDTYRQEIFNKFKVTSLEGEVLTLEQLHMGKAVILNFVVGTWCPMCLGHLKGIYKTMKDRINEGNMEVVLISTESEKRILNSFNRYSYTESLEEFSGQVKFGSDSSKALINALGIRIPIFGFARPATFLLESCGKLYKVSEGIPNEEKTVCELAHYV